MSTPSSESTQPAQPAQATPTELTASAPAASATPHQRSIEGSTGTEPPRTWAAVKDVGYIAHKNKRRRMEDAHNMDDSFMDNSKQAFFAIYDGHGGRQAADYAADHLQNNLKEKFKADPELSPEKIETHLKDVFKETDDGMKSTVPTAGCTAVVAIIKELNGEKHLCVANVGDARAVLSRGGKAERLTYEHKASDPAETERINNAKGFVVGGRVNGIIAVARALGDHNMKSYIISDPHTRTVKLEKDDDILIVACDGIWDTVEDQQAVDIAREDLNASAFDMCKKIYTSSVKAGSQDNITVIVIKL